MAPRPEMLRKHLFSWYYQHARDLPWRRTQNPYKIWVSEIMLQQTQVNTVIPYYKRWLERFPTLKSLAQAELNEVMPLWAGLGYYRRVKMLHSAAQFVEKQLNGSIPSDVADLLKIPGIGRYTAGAIASIAFQKKAPLVDGNVIRVFTRLYAIAHDTAQTQTLKRLWALAAELVPLKRPGDFNQALMELGATVCTPKNPACLLCPVRSECRAFAAGTPEKFPVSTRKEKLEKINTSALILRSPDNKVFLKQQPLKERWGGLWMFPFAAELKELTQSFGIKNPPAKHSLLIKHGFTKYSIALHVYETAVDAKLAARLRREKAARWIAPSELKQTALPSPHKKIARYILEQDHALITA